MRRELRSRTIDDPRAEALFIGQHRRRRGLELPHNAERGQCSQQGVGRINLPPSETLPDAALASVVIIVPALAHREKRQQPVVAGVVARHVPPASVKVRERIDRKCRVINEHCTPEEPDDEA